MVRNILTQISSLMQLTIWEIFLRHLYMPTNSCHQMASVP